MGVIEVTAERRVEAPAERVYACLADMREHHPQFLPPAFSGYEVEAGGVGAGTITRFTVTVGPRSRAYRMRVDEPEPGRVLRETDTGSSLVTTFTVDPEAGAARVRITTTWQGSSGMGGIFERRFAPPALRALYEDELARLDAHVRGHLAAAPAALS